MSLKIRLLQLLLLVLVLVVQLPAMHVQLADASFFANEPTAEASGGQGAPETYWVDCDGYCGDGSQDHPFCSVSDALNAADDPSVSRATIRVNNSWCAEDLSIRKSTDIIGQGSLTTIEGTVTNNSGAALRLANLAIYGDGTDPAVSVDGANARTILDSVTIESATGYGVRQNGGSLNASGLLVVSTTPHSSDDGNGAAIYLEGGARARLEEIQLYDNDVTGLLVSGNTTWASLGDVVVDGKVRALGAPGFVASTSSSGLETRDGGLLTAGWRR